MFNNSRAIPIALCAFASLLVACVHPAGQEITGSPAPASSIVSTSPQLSPEISIVVGVVPATQLVGQPCFLQVKVLPKQPIAAGTLSVVTDSSDINILPREIELKDIRPPLSGHNAPGRSRREPPALGMVPIYTFRIEAVTPGDHTLVVKFAYGNKEIRQQLTIKGDMK